MYSGPHISKEGLVFGMDSGFPFVSKNHESYKFNLGQPTTTFNVGDMVPTNADTYFTSSNTYHSNMHGTPWDWAFYPNSNIASDTGMEWEPNHEGPGFIGAWKMKQRPGGNSESNLQGNNPGTISQTKTYTISVWCKTTTASTFRIHINTTKDGSSYWGYASGYHTGGGAWERLSLTIPANAGNTSINTLRCQGTGNNKTADAYWRNYQVEEGANPTPFILNGTRHATGSIIDLKETTDINLSNVTFDSNAQITFDGTDDVITAAGVGISNYSSPFSMECVFKVPTSGTWANNRKSNVFSIAGSYSGQYGIYKESTDTIGFQIRDASTGGYCSSTGHSKDVYHHVIITFGGGSGMNLYINGELKSGNTTSFSGAPDSTNLHIGGQRAFGGSPGSFYDGEIPVAKYYDRELTLGEVKVNYRGYKKRFNL